MIRDVISFYDIIMIHTRAFNDKVLKLLQIFVLENVNLIQMAYIMTRPRLKLTHVSQMGLGEVNIR